jgi:hypothetical protein
MLRGYVNAHEPVDSPDRELVWAFGSLSPRIAAFPHCIFESTPKALGQCCSVVEAVAAPWRTEVVFEANGEYFIRYTYTPEMVHLWEVPQNQTVLPKLMYSDLEFSLLVSAGTSPQILRQTWEHPIDDYYSHMDQLPQWIDSLGWAYISLEYENRFAMLVTPKSKGHWVSEIERRLASEKIPPFHLIAEDHGVRWDGPWQFDE